MDPPTAVTGTYRVPCGCRLMAERCRTAAVNAQEASMLRLRDIMTTDVITVDPNLSIREAMDVFTSRRISGAPVVAGGEVIGVVSATDLLQFAAALPGVPTEREAAPEWLGDITGDEDGQSTLAEAGGEDDPSALYFTELWDDAGATVSERIVSQTGAEWNSLEEHTVSEA